VYLGWITVATVANITDVLFYLQWSGWGISAETWFVIVLGAVAAIATSMALLRSDVAYLLVLVWALIGIALKHADAPVVPVAAWVVTIYIVGLVVIAAVRSRSTPPELAAA
jgi:benzodiazapine receptor